MLFPIQNIIWTCILVKQYFPLISSLERNFSLECDDLQMGQYYCTTPEIDPKTQQLANCDKATRRTNVKCYPAIGIRCNGMSDNGFFTRQVPCKWTNGKKFSTALLLSVFLGMFGVDRFYLGYPAIGLFKFCTLGFMFLGHLLDILLIALQVVKPSDGSDYIIDYYGPGMIKLSPNNETYIQPPSFMNDEL